MTLIDFEQGSTRRLLGALPILGDVPKVRGNIKKVWRKTRNHTSNGKSAAYGRTESDISSNTKKVVFNQSVFSGRKTIPQTSKPGSDINMAPGQSGNGIHLSFYINFNKLFILSNSHYGNSSNIPLISRYYRSRKNPEDFCKNYKSKKIGDFGRFCEILIFWASREMSYILLKFIQKSHNENCWFILDIIVFLCLTCFIRKLGRISPIAYFVNFVKYHIIIWNYNKSLSECHWAERSRLDWGIRWVDGVAWTGRRSVLPY